MTNSNLVDKQCKETGWQTPEHILSPVRLYSALCDPMGKGGIALDPATTNDNPTLASWHLTENDGADGLSANWRLIAGDEGVVFLNPPYGREFPLWAEKIGKEAKNGAHIVALLPSNRFETQYYQKHILTGRLDAICFVRKRIRFLNANGKPYGSNPYGSVILLFNGRYLEFASALSSVGAVIRPTLLTHPGDERP
jgi:site-specific DNA-methyltransferase (adenine-specific)